MYRFLLLLSIAGLFGCDNPQREALAGSTVAEQPRTGSLSPVSPAEVQELLNQGAQLLDVRTQGEVASGILRGAAHANINAGGFDAAVARLATNKPVITYCAAGVRACRAAKRLIDLGFTRVYYVSEAGYSELVAAGLPTQ